MDIFFLIFNVPPVFSPTNYLLSYLQLVMLLVELVHHLIFRVNG